MKERFMAPRFADSHTCHKIKKQIKTCQNLEIKSPKNVISLIENKSYRLKTVFVYFLD